MKISWMHVGFAEPLYVVFGDVCYSGFVLIYKNRQNSIVLLYVNLFFGIIFAGQLLIN